MCLFQRESLALPKFAGSAAKTCFQAFLTCFLVFFWASSLFQDRTGAGSIENRERSDPFEEVHKL
jgi:hypothetical protein